VPHYRDLTPADEQALLDAQLNRVTDTCIPEAEAMRRVENVLIDEWIAVEKRGERLQPHQFFYRILLDGRLERFYQIDPRHSWLLAAAEQNLPIFAPGWEDSTIGNVFAARCLDGRLRDPHTVCSGIENLVLLVDWYRTTSASAPMGLVQIGGGIAGDFSIAVVSLLRQDLREERVPLWKYFCQISDSTTSYGSYSGAVPNEKITWGKLGVDTPRFVIESDATIAAPLLFARVLGW
jgi:deoxyhypusine synthase